MFDITFNSKSILDFISSFNFEYLLLAPTYVKCLRYAFSMSLILSLFSSKNLFGILNLGNKTSRFKSKKSILSTNSLMFEIASGRSSNKVIICSGDFR